jgi:hypothetical protein
MLSAIMLSVAFYSLFVIMLSAVMVNVTTLGVDMLNFVMLSVVAPFFLCFNIFDKYLSLFQHFPYFIRNRSKF